jgi:hypothetical protein
MAHKSKGVAGNNPNRGSKIVTRKRKSGPNKGKSRRMREFTDVHGKKHSAPATKKAKGHKKF